MSAVGQVEAGITSNYDAAKTAKTNKSNYGNTIGDVQLSDKASKYYDQLKKKYSDMDFVLVSNDEVDGAEQKAAKYANSNRTLVLIDAEKIEKMAEDEEYRKKYEGIIGNASSQLDSLKEQLGVGTLANVKTFGIKVDDQGNTSFFAVVDKSLSAQKDRIAENAKKKTQAKKAEAKKETEKKTQQKLAEARKAKTGEKEKTSKAGESGETETITASSVEELIKKINDSYYAGLSDRVRTEAEMQVGTQMDFRL